MYFFTQSLKKIKKAEQNFAKLCKIYFNSYQLQAEKEKLNFFPKLKF